MRKSFLVTVRLVKKPKVGWRVRYLAGDTVKIGTVLHCGASVVHIQGDDGQTDVAFIGETYRLKQKGGKA